ncbi:MAG TPA: recombinase family protein [Patescibacteria group bacterium]|nr:recombinase family protein [Patescibacteria group bacterium]
MNAYAYIRVSTEEQKNHGYSPDNQIRHCREYAKLHGYNIKRIFDDSGKSGRTSEKRPALQDLLREIDEHPVEAVIIYKIDRFARNVGDFDRMYKSLKAKGIKLLSINEGDLMEGNSLIPNIFASVAQWESEVNSSRTKDALQQKFEEGWQPYSRYPGYRSVGGKDEKKTCEPDPYTAPIIKELFELYSTGNYSIIELQDWLAEKNILSRNGTTLGHSVIDTILNNPFYYGLARWHGVSKMGKHKPIIKKELYDVCQYTLGKHRSFLLRRRVHDFLLRGFLICAECGQRYTAEWHKDADKLKNRDGKIAYYHCQKRDRNGCPAPYVQMDVMEELVEEKFKKMEFSEEFINAVVGKTKEILNEARRTSSSSQQGILNQKTALETKRNRIEDSLTDGVIDRETFKRMHNGLQEQIIKLDNQMTEADNKQKIDVDLIEEVLSFSRNIHKTYIEAPNYLKRHYLRFFFESFVIGNKKIYKTVPTPIFKILENSHEIIIRGPQLRG